jgi:uncharacterized protein with PIN domain
MDYKYNAEGNVCTFFDPDDEIVLMVDKYENRSHYYFETHPNLHKGWYVTNMRRRLAYVFETGKKTTLSNSILRKDYFEYIDDLWFYINWVFYFSENGKNITTENRITGEEFINTLINDNYTGVFSELQNRMEWMQKYKLHKSKSELYEEFLSSFAFQVWNYVLRSRKANEWESMKDKSFRDRVRRLFNNGDYRYLIIEHDGFIYGCQRNEENGQNDKITNVNLRIRIDDDNKFNSFMDSLVDYNVRCEKMDSQETIIVDDLIDNTKKEDKTETIINEINDIETFTHDKLKTYDEEPWRIMIKRAKCPYCGGELVSRMPTMYNPFSFEASCVCECIDCHKVIKTDKAYPHVTVWGHNGEEITNVKFQ